jgi:hypothetical protein
MFQDGIERVTTPKVPRAMPGTEITVVPCTLYTFRFPLKGQCHKSYFSFSPDCGIFVTVKMRQSGIEANCS